VFKGEPVLVGKLGRGLQYLANELPEGMKACTVKITDEENSMKGLIKPGNHVDCFWLPMKPDLSTTSVVQLLQNVKVLAVGERIEGDDPELDAVSRLAKSANESNYTLLVDTMQNKRVIAATFKGGKFRLVLRGRGDNSIDNSIEEMDQQRLDEFLGLRKPDGSIDADTESLPLAGWEVEYTKGPDQSSEVLNVSESRRSSAKK
jgi:Flp pilus assembly protein CpaB